MQIIKQIFTTCLLSLILLTFGCSKGSQTHYTSLYTFQNESVEIIASDKDQIVEIQTYRQFGMKDFPTFADIEIVAEGTTAIENTDYVLSSKRVDYKDIEIPRGVTVILTCHPSFTKGKTLKLRLRYDEHPNIVAHMKDTMVITAK